MAPCISITLLFMSSQLCLLWLVRLLQGILITQPRGKKSTEATGSISFDSSKSGEELWPLVGAEPTTKNLHRSN